MTERFSSHGRKLAFVSLFLVTAGLLRAESSAELQDQLRIAVRSEIQSAIRDRNPESRTLQFMLVEFSQAETGAPAGASLENAVRGIQATSNSVEVKELCRRLGRQIYTEQEKRDAALTEEVRDGLASALREALSAQSNAALNAPAQTIARLAEKANAAVSNNEQLRDLARQGQRFAEYIRRYQDFAVGLESGESLSPRWDEMLNSSDGFSTIIPRSEVLIRSQKVRSRIWTTAEQESRAREIMQDVHGLEDIDGVLVELEKIKVVRLNGEFSPYLHYTLATLFSYQVILRDLEAGRSTAQHLRDVTQNGIAASDDLLSDLRTLLLLRAIPKLLGTQQTLPPEVNDNAATYLERVAVTARSRGDWAMFERALALGDDLTIEPTRAHCNRVAADLLLGGRNLERAGEYSAAVCAYEAALQTGSDLVPAEAIGAWLDQLRSAHPQEFDKGRTIALRARQPSFFFLDDRRSLSFGMGGASLFDLNAPAGELVVPAVSGQTPAGSDPKAAN